VFIQIFGLPINHFGRAIPSKVQRSFLQIVQHIAKYLNLNGLTKQGDQRKPRNC